jgi:heterotetrameric sarcosine oxidase gamma subunit|tara:strand:- start:18406 stop:18990 length:585 start_codon:yes stop_codon:yes gene_type:complete
VLERNSALKGQRIHGRFGKATEQPGVTIEEIREFSYLDISLWEMNKASLRSKLAELLGIQDLPARQGSIALSGGRLFSLEAGHLGYLGEAGPADILAAAIAPEEGSVVSLGHGYCCLRLGGPMVINLLRRGIRQDLRDKAFPVHHVVRADIGGIDLLLLRRDGGHFDLLVPRSHAPELWRWLTRRAAQFGYQVL